MANEESILDKIDELEEKIRIATTTALQLKHEILNKRGWIITKEVIGPTLTYCYQKGEKFYFDEDEALSDHG